MSKMPPRSLFFSVVMTFKAHDRQSQDIVLGFVVVFIICCLWFCFDILLLLDLSVASAIRLLLSFMRPQDMYLTG